MTIHHSQIKKAEKLGFTLEEIDDDTVRAFWPKRALQVFGTSGSDAMAQMQAAMVLIDDYHIKPTADTPRLVSVSRRDDGWVLKGCPMPPVAAHKVITLDGNPQFEDPSPFFSSLQQLEQAEMATTEEQIDDDSNHSDVDNDSSAADGAVSSDATVERSDKGIALDGAVAYSEGTPAGDCPYSSETEDDEEYANFERWNEEWDAAADEATDDEKGGSVVAQKYRAKYAELGHPTHCGDWLAELLNNLCLTKKEGTDLERFEAICQANGVDTSKYKRDGIGWQGRLRMTGRNLLAKRVYLAGGVVKTPVEGAEPEYRAPADWMAAQRFKMPKADQDKPIPTPGKSDG